MKLEGPGGHEASNKVREASRQTRFLPGLLEDGDAAEKALQDAEDALAKKERDIANTEAKTVDTNNQLTASREELSKTMDQITTIDKKVDANKGNIANNTNRIGAIDAEIKRIEEGIGNGSPEQFEAVSTGNKVTLSPEDIKKIEALKAEKATLIAANAALDAENKRLAQEKMSLVAIRDNLQKNVIPPLEAEIKRLTDLHKTQITDKGTLTAARDKKAGENRDIQSEIKTQEKMIAQMDEAAIERIQEYEEHVAAEERPGPGFLDYGKSVWA